MNNENMVKSIKQLCQNNNISISQLEAALNFSPSLISRWKDKTPSLDKIVDIADYFHVSLDEVVGYKPNIDDDFLNKLYEKTDCKRLIWHSAMVVKKDCPKLDLYNRMNDPISGGYYDTEKFDEKTYVTQYNHGYFMLYAFYKYGEVLNPIELSLIIQPSDNSHSIFQKYKKEELSKLWIKVLNNLGDETPIEIKVEDFKNNFLNDKEI